MAKQGRQGFCIGDIVRLKVGGPDVLLEDWIEVEDPDDMACSIIWFDLNHVFRREVVEVTHLVHVGGHDAEA